MASEGKDRILPGSPARELVGHMYGTLRREHVTCSPSLSVFSSYEVMILPRCLPMHCPNPMKGPYYDEMPDRLLAIGEESDTEQSLVDDEENNGNVVSTKTKADVINLSLLAVSVVSSAKQQCLSHSVQIYDPKPDEVSAAASAAISSVLPGVSLVVLQALQVRN